MNIVNWTYGSYGKDNYMDKKEILIGENTSISIGSYEGLQFSVCGLGLTKSEREFFDSSFLKIRNQVNIYLGKIIISYNPKGYIKSGLKNVDVKWTMNLGEFLKFRIDNHFKYTFKKKVENLASKLLKKFIFTKKEDFTIIEYWSEPKKIKCDRLTAYQLASNYESDLYDSKGKFLLCPLGFEYEENKNLIKKNLGRLFVTKKKFNLLGYSNWNDVEVIK